MVFYFSFHISLLLFFIKKDFNFLLFFSKRHLLSPKREKQEGKKNMGLNLFF